MTSGAAVAIASAAVDAILEREGKQASCAYVSVDELAERLGVTRAQVLRELADAVEAGVFTATAVEVSR